MYWPAQPLCFLKGPGHSVSPELRPNLTVTTHLLVHLLSEAGGAVLTRKDFIGSQTESQIWALLPRGCVEHRMDCSSLILLPLSESPQRIT